jgi:hypothetical protein
VRVGVAFLKLAVVRAHALSKCVGVAELHALLGRPALRGLDVASHSVGLAVPNIELLVDIVLIGEGRLRSLRLHHLLYIARFRYTTGPFPAPTGLRVPMGWRVRLGRHDVLKAGDLALYFI